MKKIIRHSLLALLTFSVANQAMAAKYWVCEKNQKAFKWKNATEKMLAAKVTFPVGSDIAMQLSEAIKTINQNPSQFRFQIQFGEEKVDPNDILNQSEIWATDDPYWFPKNSATHAHTYVKGHCYANSAYFNENDIMFNANVTFTLSKDTNQSMSYVSGKPPTFLQTAIHELTHAMGLDHDTTTYNLVGTLAQGRHGTANAGKRIYYQGENAGQGVVSLYGASQFEDVSVSHFKLQFGGEVASAHTFTEITGPNDEYLISTKNNEGMRAYKLKPGQAIKAEFTFENNGNSTQSDIKVYYVISVNNNITLNDLKFKSASLTLSPDEVATYRKDLTIPGFLSPGFYWLGVIVDADNSINEVREDNNATYLPVEILPPDNPNQKKQ